MRKVFVGVLSVISLVVLGPVSSFAASYACYSSITPDYDTYKGLVGEVDCSANETAISDAETAYTDALDSMSTSCKRSVAATKKIMNTLRSLRAKAYSTDGKKYSNLGKGIIDTYACREKRDGWCEETAARQIDTAERTIIFTCAIDPRVNKLITCNPAASDTTCDAKMTAVARKNGKLDSQYKSYKKTADKTIAKLKTGIGTSCRSAADDAVAKYDTFLQASIKLAWCEGGVADIAGTLSNLKPLCDSQVKSPSDLKCT